MSASELSATVKNVAEIAARHAEDVDAGARFPSEAFDALRERRMLALSASRRFGGAGSSFRDVAEVCTALSAACASTGMIYAMHTIQIACLNRHGASAWMCDFLTEAARDQLLLASSTTDGAAGGDAISSSCALEMEGSRFRLVKNAAVVSYAEASDAILVTARRSRDALPNDQVLVCMKRSDLSLTRIREWNALGMRGTCSAGFDLSGIVTADQVLRDSFEVVRAQTLLPVAHILWGATWVGIAVSAVERARKYLRHASRTGASPAGSRFFSEALASLSAAKAITADAAHRLDSAGSVGEASSSSLDALTGLHALKINVSELCVETVMLALKVCGLAGYRTDGDYSVARQLRDVSSAPLMINNGRLHSTMEKTALMNAISGSL